MSIKHPSHENNGSYWKNATYGSWQDNAVGFFCFVFCLCEMPCEECDDSEPVDGQD